MWWQQLDSLSVQHCVSSWQSRHLGCNNKPLQWCAAVVDSADVGCGWGLWLDCCLQVLRGARIVGMTTTGLANQQGLLHGLKPKVGSMTCWAASLLCSWLLTLH